MNMRIFFLLSIFASLHMLIQAHGITLYQHRGHRGDVYDLHSNSGQCVNVVGHFNDRTSSISTHGQCFYLYRDKDCTGERVEVSLRKSNQCDHGRLSKCGAIDFNDKLTSVKAC